jgi:DNA-binding transcriptional LysR family regulator
MELRQLRQFAVLAETLSFRGAADRLHMAQPPLSVSIRKLEEEFGVRLFDRTQKGVQLTEAGRAALADARKSLFHATEAMRNAKATVHGVGGRLRIGFVGSSKYTLLPRLLPLFRSQYAEVMLELHEGSNTKITRAIEARDLDVGVVRVPFASLNKLNYETVETDVFVAALPAGHRLTAQPTVSITDLADEPFVHYAADVVPGLHALTMLCFQSSGHFPRGGQEAVQVQTVICLVESGLGVALVPSRSRVQLTDRWTIRELAPLPPMAHIGLAVIYDPEYEPATARRFRALALQLSSEPEAGGVCN